MIFSRILDFRFRFVYTRENGNWSVVTYFMRVIFLKYWIYFCDFKRVWTFTGRYGLIEMWVSGEAIYYELFVLEAMLLILSWPCDLLVLRSFAIVNYLSGVSWV